MKLIVLFDLSELHLIKTPSNRASLCARAYSAWRGSEKHAGVLWRGFFYVQRRENLRVGVLNKNEKKKKKERKLGHHFYYDLSFFAPHCCWAALHPPLRRRNRRIPLAESWGRPAGVGDTAIGWFERTDVIGGEAGRGWGGVVAERSQAMVMLPSHWVTMAPWGESWGCGRGCVCICATGEGIKWECGLHCADWSDKVIGWERKNRKRGRAIVGRKKKCGPIWSLLAAGGVCAENISFSLQVLMESAQHSCFAKKKNNKNMPPNLLSPKTTQHWIHSLAQQHEYSMNPQPARW